MAGVLSAPANEPARGATTSQTATSNASATSRSADWFQWRGPNRNSATPEVMATDWPEGGPPKLWSAKVGGGCGCVVVRDGRTFAAGTVGGQCFVYAFDAASGDLK
jgi:hypothetical protein